MCSRIQYKTAFPLTALNDRGAHMDLHDGISMGSFVVAFDVERKYQ